MFSGVLGVKESIYANNMSFDFILAIILNKRPKWVHFALREP